jgi:GntR family transcriptional regulator, N-acetylglucosamine utilization regulator
MPLIASSGHGLKIDRMSPIPLYLQIRQWLLPRILNWTDPLEKFYSDDELATQFGVSKMTVRQALNGLVDDGYLERTRGRGTFIRDQVFEERLSARMDIESQYETAGHNQTVNLDEYIEINACARHAAILQMDEGDPVLYIRRVRSVSEIPVAVDERWIPADIARLSEFQEDAATGSIFDRVAAKVQLSRLDWQITIQSANERDAALLLVEKATPLLARSMIYIDEAGRPVLHGLTAHRGDMARYSVSLPIDSSFDEET